MHMNMNWNHLNWTHIIYYLSVLLLTVVNTSDMHFIRICLLILTIVSIDIATALESIDKKI